MQTGRPGDAHDDFSLRLAWDAGDDVAAPEPDAAVDGTSRGATRSSGAAVADPSELRRLAAAVDDLRSDIVGLRAVVLDSPQLGSALDEIASLRAETTGLHEEVASLRDELRTAMATRIAPARRAAGASGAPKAGGTAAEVAGLADEVAALRDELASLRRRIPLRAEGGAELDAAQVRRIADLLADRLLGGAAQRRPSG